MFFPSYRVFEKAPAVLDTKTAAKLLRVSQGTVKRYCREGRIPASKPCGKYFIDRDELRAFLKGKKNAD